MGIRNQVGALLTLDVVCVPVLNGWHGVWRPVAQLACRRLALLVASTTSCSASLASATSKLIYFSLSCFCLRHGPLPLLAFLFNYAPQIFFVTIAVVISFAGTVVFVFVFGTLAVLLGWRVILRAALLNTFLRGGFGRGSNNSY